MVEPPGMSTIFGLPISTAVGVATQVGSGVMVGIPRVVSGTRLPAPITIVVVLQKLSGTAAATSQARHLSRISTPSGAIGGGLVALGGARVAGSSLEEVSYRTICRL